MTHEGLSANSDYEAEFLELASKPGMETLRRECPFRWPVEEFPKGHGSACACQNRNWVPLPEEERLGALVRVASEGRWKSFTDGHVEVLLAYDGARWHEAITFEAALTRALLAAAGQ